MGLKLVEPVKPMEVGGVGLMGKEKVEVKMGGDLSDDDDEPGISGIMKQRPKLVMNALPVEVNGLGMIELEKEKVVKLKGQGGDEMKKKEIVEIIDHSVMDNQDLVEKLGLFMFRDAEVLNNRLQGKLGNVKNPIKAFSKVVAAPNLLLSMELIKSFN